MRDDPSFDFSQTKLLTLSACDTAMGGAEGDGREVDGLGNVAHDKGAEAVLASLWAVNDKSTGLLMQEMYRLWTTAPGMTKSEALAPRPILSAARSERRFLEPLLLGAVRPHRQSALSSWRFRSLTRDAELVSGVPHIYNDVDGRSVAAQVGR